MTRALVALAALLLVGTATARADPQPVEQWAASPETVLDLPRAWEVSQGAGVIVAVVDSGVRLTHPDLAPNLWRNPPEIPGNHSDDDGNGYVDDIHGVDLTGEHSLDDGQGHGTHVAGTIAAARNGKGVVGVAYKAKLMTVRSRRGSRRSRGIVDAGLVDRPLTRSDPPGLTFTSLADSTTVGFVTRGAPAPDLARILRWIADSATPR